MKIICPNCAQVLQGTEKSLGHRAKCPKCETVFRVTAERCPDLSASISDESLKHRQTANAIDAPAHQSTQMTHKMAESIADPKLERQKRWVMIISAVGLTCVATLLITVFALRRSYTDKSEVVSANQGRIVHTENSPVSKTTINHQETSEKKINPTTSTDSSLSRVSENAKSVKNTTLSPKKVDGPNPSINLQTELSTSDLVEKVDRSICKIECGFSSGTGFLVAPAIVATNAHVVDSWDELNCYFPGNYVAAKAQILWFNPDVDIAFLSVTIDRSPLEITNSDDAKRGEKVVVIGYPGTVGESVSSSVTTGILSNRTSIAGISYHQTDAAINSGNSGGPVFDKFGKVIGIATLKETNKENIGYVLPVSYIFSEYADMHKSTPQERLSKLALCVRDSDIKAVEGGKTLVILMLADIESAWSDAIKYDNDFERAVRISSEKHGGLAELTATRMKKIDTNLDLYKQTLTERQVRSLNIAKNIIIEACDFVKSPSGNYRRFEQYWVVKVSELQEMTKILESTINQ
ncbi:MAG: trypsin-like peptidase domain-containing protein [Sedimentisphaerales bacterium]|jgi:S1-C subfamily serine protease/phage FluMu protein Com